MVGDALQQPAKAARFDRHRSDKGTFCLWVDKHHHGSSYHTIFAQRRSSAAWLAGTQDISFFFKLVPRKKKSTLHRWPR